MNEKKKIISPEQLKHRIPLSEEIFRAIEVHRQGIRAILEGKDSRLMVIVGPCSFHDPLACSEYAHRLKKLADEVSDKLFIIMRVYLEKPRTTLSWKGYVSDPYCDETFDIEAGIYHARQFMLALGALNLPIATEVLNPFTQEYVDELLSWAAIGARTSASQLHREMASGLAMPVGFKNATSGRVEAALNGILFSSHPHVFLNADASGHVHITKTSGNPYAHLIMRGSESGPNYSAEHVAVVEEKMEARCIPKRIIMDCSHGNAIDDFRFQKTVFLDIIKQKNAGNQSIKGVMMESFLVEGHQAMTSMLQYGCSITDPCLGWDDTEQLIKEAHRMLVLT
jgi:3-deoxy-7-phosphoheptulonate synthase